MSPTHVLTATSTQSTIHELQCTTELCIEPQHGFHWAKTAIYWVCGFAHSRLKCLSTSERKTRKRFRISPFLQRKQSRLFFSHSTEAVPQTNRVPHVGVWIYPPPHLLSEHTKQVWVHDSGTDTVSRRTTAPQSYITMHIATIWTIVLHTPATVKVTMTVDWHVHPPTHLIKVRKV